MKTSGQGGRYPHDHTEVNVLGIFPPGWILKSLNGPVGVLGSPLSKFFRSAFPQADDPTPEGKYKEHPKGSQERNDEIQRKMEDIFGGLCRGEGPANDPNRYEERKAVEKGSENSHWDLELDIVRGFVGHHVLRKSRVDGPPVADYVQNNEEEEEDRKEYLDRTSFSFIKIENLMQGVPPS